MLAPGLDGVHQARPEPDLRRHGPAQRAARTRSARSSARAGTPAACRAGASGAPTPRCAPAEAHLHRRDEHPDHHRLELAGRPRRRPLGEHLRRRDLRRPPRPARLGPARLQPSWPSATERTETMAVEPAQAPPIRVVQHAQAQDPHAAQARHLHLRPRPEPRRLGEADGAAGPRAPRSSCASARSSTRTARSTPPTCAPRCRRTRTRSRDQGTETYEPRFTYHGFRYVEVTGFPGTPTLDTNRGPRGQHRRARVRHVHVQQPARELDPERDPLGPELELPGRADRRLPARRAPRLDRRHPGLRLHRRLQRRHQGLPGPVAADAARLAVGRRRLPRRRARHLLRRAAPRAGATPARSCRGRSTAATATRACCRRTTTR